MCDDCRKLQEELDKLRKKWDSPELTYSRSIELAYRKFGGPCDSITIGPSGNILKSDWDKLQSYYNSIGYTFC